MRLVPAVPWLCAAALLGAGCSGEPVPASAPAVELIAGPLRWLMLPQEARQARRITNNREAVEFLDAFWRRRNPEPGSPTNECSRVFHERVAAADRLYGEGAQRGSMTDRGRALVLLGPPPVLRYDQRRLQVLDPGKSAGVPSVPTRLVEVETWAYPLSELTPELASRVAAESASDSSGYSVGGGQESGGAAGGGGAGGGGAGGAGGGTGGEGGAAATPEPAQVVFLADSPGHVRLLEGERLLQLAAQAMVREPPVSRRSGARPRTPAWHPGG